jgi:hypothetical protein
VTNLVLQYASATAPNEHRSNVELPPGLPFEFEGREWDARAIDEQGVTLCVEHVRTFKVRFEQAFYVYSGPRPEVGETIRLEHGPRVRVRKVAPAHHDSLSGSLTAERVEDPHVLVAWAAAMRTAP